MASYVKNSIWARVFPGDFVYDIEFESLLLTHIAYSGKPLSASSFVAIHCVADSGEERIWDVGTLLASQREHIEVCFPFHGNKRYSIHVRGPSKLCLSGITLNVGTSELTRHCARCGGDPPQGPSSSTVTTEAFATAPQVAAAAKKSAGKKRVIVGAARVLSSRQLKAATAGPTPVA